MAMPSYNDAPQAYGMPALKPDYRRGSRKRPAAKPSGKVVMLDSYDSTLIKPLEAIAGLELNPASLEGQIEPEFMNVPFAKIRVDLNLQRELKQANLTLIEFGVNHFDYTKVKVPNGFMSPKGHVYLVDGQSTALIYLHHPELRARGYVPCFVSRVSQAEFVSRCAQAFVALNECHVPVTRADRFTALLTARDPKSRALADILRANGLTITGEHKAENRFAAGETRLIQTLQGIFERRGEEFFSKLCQIAGKAAYSPIKRIHIAALVQILDKDKEGKLDIDRLVSAIRSMADRHAQNEAHLNAKRRAWTGPFALAELYKDRYKKAAQAL